MAHECGHFVLHNGIETGDTKTETEANMFASAFMFPRSAFVAEFPSFFDPTREKSWMPLYRLKARWGISLKAIIYRAHFLKVISSQQYRAANVRLSKTGQSRVERYDDEVLYEVPHLLRSSIELIGSELGVSFSKIAKSLCITPKLLSVITGIPIPPEATYENNVESFFRTGA